jgi:ankyrin repeat protein
MKLFNENLSFPMVRRQFLAAIPVLFFMTLMSNMAVADETNAFFLAVARDNGYWVAKLLDNGIDPNVKDTGRGDTGLILALREHAMRAFDVLLNAPKINLDASSDNGDTALMIASYTGNQAAVAALLDKDAEVNKPGWTALHYAAAIGNCEIITLLLDKFAYIDAESPSKSTPVMMAARAGQLAAVKLLVEAGADATLGNAQGLSATDLAIANDHQEIAEWLTNTLKQAGKH